MIGARWNSAMKLSCMPIQAPSTVGTSESASSQYVLRRTRLRSTPSVAVAPGRGIGRPEIETGCSFGSIASSNAGPDRAHS